MNAGVQMMLRISNDEFDRVVEEALESVPGTYLENVVVEVRSRPDARLKRELGVPDDALGFYDGAPLQDALSSDRLLPSHIYIFRNNLIEMCESRDELYEEIRITVLHEIAHHFGIDEDRLEELGYD